MIIILLALLSMLGGCRILDNMYVNVGVKYREPSTYKDGRPLDSLDRTVVSYYKDGVLLEEKSIPASSVNGGGSVSYSKRMSVNDIASDNVSVTVYAVTKSGIESDRVVKRININR